MLETSNEDPILEIPTSGDEEYDAAIVKQYADRDLKVAIVSGDTKVTTKTTEVAGQTITTKQVVVPETKSAADIEAQRLADEAIAADNLKVEAQRLAEEAEEAEETKPKLPEGLICPHCGAKARTEASYLKNHGDACLSK